MIVAVTAMQPVSDADPELAWLEGRTDDEGMTGFDASGWEASTWVLHAMYENSSLPSEVSYHDHRQQAITEGVIDPLIVNGLNLDELTTDSGTVTGFLRRPGPDWSRLRWRALAERSGLMLGANELYPPCHRWFPITSWPISIDPPPEGSLDEANLEALVSILADHSPGGRDTPCAAFYTSLATGDFDRRTVLAGSLGSVPDLVQDGSRFGSTPSNLWPVDRSWLVWTDWDLWGTKVSGSRVLIDAIIADSEIETLDWNREPAR
jgi:hypothetical protein